MKTKCKSFSRTDSTVLRVVRAKPNYQSQDFTNEGNPVPGIKVFMEYWRVSKNSIQFRLVSVSDQGEQIEIECGFISPFDEHSKKDILLYFPYCNGYGRIWVLHCYKASDIPKLIPFVSEKYSIPSGPLLFEQSVKEEPKILFEEVEENENNLPIDEVESDDELEPIQTPKKKFVFEPVSATAIARYCKIIPPEPKIKRSQLVTKTRQIKPFRFSGEIELSALDYAAVDFVCSEYGISKDDFKTHPRPGRKVNKGIRNAHLMLSVILFDTLRVDQANKKFIKVIGSLKISDFYNIHLYAGREYLSNENFKGRVNHVTQQIKDAFEIKS